MRQITRHPILAKADALKRAFLLNGFTLHDDGLAPEVQTSDWAVESFARPDAVSAEPVLLEEGAFAMRSDLLIGQLADMAQSAAAQSLASAAVSVASRDLAAPDSFTPVRHLVCGRVFDRRDTDVPSRLMLEGVVATDSFSLAAYEDLWRRVVKSVYGIEADVELAPMERTAQALAAGITTYEVRVRREGEKFPLAYTGAATHIARSLLQTLRPGIETWAFSICVDDLAMRDAGVATRRELYSPLMSFLTQFADDEPAMAPTPFLSNVADVLRTYGYQQICGVGAYDDNAYRNMNMIMESWDLNNRGYLIKDPIGTFTRMPTVLTPSLEDALEANERAGEPEARIFEINHHYVLPGIGQPPVEKMSISFGAYGPELDKQSFRKEVDAILDDLGVKNHFAIPIDMAIPYDPANCNLIMDENMQYLGGQYGSVNKVALERHGSQGPWFIFQCEVEPLAAKAATEFGRVPDELK